MGRGQPCDCATKKNGAGTRLRSRTAWSTLGRGQAIVNREMILVDFSFVVEALLDKEQRSCGFATWARKSGALAGCMLLASTSTKRMLRACMPLLSLATGRGTARALHGGKGKETSLLSIKTQRRADTAWFRNGSDLSSHVYGSTEIGWTLLVWPPFWLEQIPAPSLSMADEREGFWRGQKVEVLFRLTTARFVHGVFVQPRAFGTVFGCQYTGYLSNLYWKLAFLGSSSRLPGNHVHGNGLPATFVPGRKNVYEGYWAADESYKKSLASLFHYFLNVKSTSQILRVYLTGKEKPVREAQH